MVDTEEFMAEDPILRNRRRYCIVKGSAQNKVHDRDALLNRIMDIMQESFLKSQMMARIKKMMLEREGKSQKIKNGNDRTVMKMRSIKYKGINKRGKRITG